MSRSKLTICWAGCSNTSWITWTGHFCLSGWNPTSARRPCESYASGWSQGHLPPRTTADAGCSRELSIRLAFLGTPEAAVPPLRALVGAGHEVAVVVTQPDRKRARGGALVLTPVKCEAIELD